MQFLLSFFVILILLFIPPFIVLKSWKFEKIAALCVAPVISMCLYPTLGLLYSIIGMPASSFTICVSVVLFTIILTAIGIYKTHNNNFDLHQKERSAFTPSTYCLLYILVGMVIGGFLFASSFGGFDSIMQSYDNIFHYNLIRHFQESTDWSSLHASLYPIEGDHQTYPVSSSFIGTYYPSSWHILCAITMQLAGTSLQSVVNASVFTFSSVVFPLGSYLLISTLFRKSSTIICGAFMTSAFACFPWGLITYYPLFPNLISTALVPAAAGFLIITMNSKNDLHKRIMKGAGFALICLLSFFFTQPNAVFTLLILLLPFFARVAYQESKAHLRKESHIAPFFITILFCSTAVALWVLAFNLPMMRDVVSYYWDPIASPANELLGIATLNYIGLAPQYILAAILLIGIPALFIKQKKEAWIAFSYLISVFVLFIATTQSDTYLKHFISGFWYTDYHRIAALVSICAIPIATIGLDCLYNLIATVIGNLLNNKRTSKTISDVVVAFLILMMFLSPNPNDSNNAFYELQKKGKERVEQNQAFYSSDEQTFIEKIKETVLPDELILNNPFDGSALAYAFDDLNVYYRYVHEYGVDSVKGADPLYDPDFNAQYYLTLGDSTPLKQYQSNDWQLLESIDESTSGFDVILEDGNMKLYKINKNAIA